MYRGFKRQVDKMIIGFGNTESGLVCSGRQIAGGLKVIVAMLTAQAAWD
jgi:hypothetical protein